jgi:hypothetical protein
MVYNTLTTSYTYLTLLIISFYKIAVLNRFDRNNRFEQYITQIKKWNQSIYDGDVKALKIL